jgi:hypothetical protein
LSSAVAAGSTVTVCTLTDRGIFDGKTTDRYDENAAHIFF